MQQIILRLCFSCITDAVCISVNVYQDEHFFSGFVTRTIKCSKCVSVNTHMHTLEPIQYTYTHAHIRNRKILGFWLFRCWNSQCLIAMTRHLNKYIFEPCVYMDVYIYRERYCYGYLSFASEENNHM